MKFFILSLLFMISVSFSGHAEQQASYSNNELTNYFCTDCWAYADSAEKIYCDALGEDSNYGIWESNFDICIEKYNPCSEVIDPVNLDIKK